MKERVRSILTDLARVRENLLAISDDIWLNIPHNDDEALEQGFKFKKAFNQQLHAFSGVANEIDRLVGEYAGVQVDEPRIVAPERTARDRAVKPLDPLVPHRLDENFTFKRPCGFRLRKDVYEGVNTWRGVFRAACSALHKSDAARFEGVLTAPDFITARGNEDFSRKESDLREPILVVPGIYAEGNLSANGFRDRLEQLRLHFGLGPDDLVVYLREDRDAE